MKSLYRTAGKRGLDVVVASAMLCVSFPMMVALSLAVKIDSPGPVFFRQTRVGRHGRDIQIHKFRSMRTLENSFKADGSPMGDKQRVTRLGRFMRRSSLDELPQLLDVLSGDMSLVGPRPALHYQVERYTETQRHRLDVRPGLTGLAQVSGRNKLSWTEKIAFDLEYVESVSLRLDLAILLRTLRVVVRPEDTDFVVHDELSRHDNALFTDIGLSA